MAPNRDGSFACKYASSMPSDQVTAHHLIRVIRAAVWEKTVVQTCIVHLLRNSFTYAAKRDWAEVAKDIKPVYTAVSEAAALDAFAEFSGKWEKRYPAVIRLWENAWAEFVPFLRFDTEIRTIICTTNASRSTRGSGGRSRPGGTSRPSTANHRVQVTTAHRSGGERGTVRQAAR